MSWRKPNISWRWIIRGTCLGLLGWCVGLWGLSYLYGTSVYHRSTSELSVQIGRGRLRGSYRQIPANSLGAASQVGMGKMGGLSVTSELSVQIARAMLRGSYGQIPANSLGAASQIGRGNMGGPSVIRVFVSPPGWSVSAYAFPPGNALRDAGSLGFTVGSLWQFGPDYRIDVPLGSATVFLGVVCWTAWRLTRRGGTARGFPVEPLASRWDSDGGGDGRGAAHVEIPVTLEATVTVAMLRTVAKKAYGDTPTHPRTYFSVSNGVDVATDVKVTKHDSMDYTVVGVTYAAPCAAVSGTLEADKVGERGRK